MGSAAVLKTWSELQLSEYTETHATLLNQNVNDIDKFKNSQSASFRRLNPHIFGGMGAGQAPKPQPNPLPALEQKPQLQQGNPCCLAIRVTLIRLGPKLFDFDNLVAGCKPLRDAIAASLGVDDADPRLEWEYLQVKSSGNPGVLVKIEAR